VKSYLRLRPELVSVVLRIVAVGRAVTARLDEFIGPKSLAVPWTNVHYTA